MTTTAATTFATKCCDDVASAACLMLALATGIYTDDMGARGPLYRYALDAHRYAHNGGRKPATALSALRHLSHALPDSWAAVDRLARAREALAGDGLVSTGDVALLAGVATTYVGRLVRTGELPGEINGRHYAVPADAAREWLRGRGVRV